MLLRNCSNYLSSVAVFRHSLEFNKFTDFKQKLDQTENITLKKFYMY